jgi:hypothetical protein
MYELYRRVNDKWYYYGTYNLSTESGVKAYTEAVWQFGANGFMVKTEAEA